MPAAGRKESDGSLRLGLLGLAQGTNVLAPVQARPFGCPLRGQPGPELRALLVGLIVARKQGETEPGDIMAFQVAELSIELIEVLAPLMPRIKQRDKSLADRKEAQQMEFRGQVVEVDFDAGSVRHRVWEAK